MIVPGSSGMRWRWLVLVVVAAMATTTMIGVTAAIADSHYAPLDRPGPALQAPADALDESLTCSGDLAAGPASAVLLVHGTNLDSEANFSWNYIPQLDELGRAYCAVDLPVYGMHDIQLAAEYVVHAIRSVADRSGRPIQVVGYSQGGMIPRWALRWWPDTRPLVEELVGLAPSNHGTATAVPSCVEQCAPAYWQQRLGADFIAAVNSYTETFDAIDYTAIYTRYDEVVTPNLDDSGSSSLAGGSNVANVATQDVCPTNTADHLAIGSYDPVGYALVIDALDNDGPADPGRVPVQVCAQVFMPGVDEQTFAEDFAAMVATIDEANQASDQAPAEPPLLCYVTASCAAGAPTDGDGPPSAPAPDATDAPVPVTPSTGGGLAIAGLAAALVAVGARRRQ